MQNELPTFADVTATMAKAECSEGWLCFCEEQNIHLVPNWEFINALSETIRNLTSGRVLEICAGNGDLSTALRKEGITTSATDVKGDENVESLDAQAALKKYSPSLVVGSFIPVDSFVEQRVVQEDKVEHFIFITAGIHSFENPIWRSEKWSFSSLRYISKWMTCRHDVWMGPNLPIMQHGEVWLLSRCKQSADQKESVEQHASISS